MSRRAAAALAPAYDYVTNGQTVQSYSRGPGPECAQAQAGGGRAYVGDIPAPPAAAGGEVAEWRSSGEFRVFVSLFNRACGELRAVDGPLVPLASRIEVAGCPFPVRRIIHSSALSIAQKNTQLQAYFRTVDIAAREEVSRKKRSTKAKSVADRKVRERKARRTCGNPSPAHVKRSPSRSPPPSAVLLLPKGEGNPPPKPRRRAARSS
jgi:hypothetical protein